MIFFFFLIFWCDAQSFMDVKTIKKELHESYQTDGSCHKQQKENNVNNHFQLLFVWQKLEKLKNSHFTFCSSICSFHLNWSLHSPLILSVLQIIPRKIYNLTKKWSLFLYSVQQNNSVTIVFLFTKARRANRSFYPVTLCINKNNKLHSKEGKYVPF